MSSSRVGWQVVIAEAGREGVVVYRESDRELRCSWELGGGDVIAIVSVGRLEDWRVRAPWAIPRRQAIVQRIATEVLRQRSPSSRADFSERLGAIHLRARDIAVPPGESTIPPLGPASPNRRRSAMIPTLAVAVVAVLAVLLIGRSMMTIRTTGAPWGTSVRAGDAIVTMMTRLQPYLPTLHRDPGKDRYTVGLLIQSARDASSRRFVELAADQPPSNLNQARLLRSHGDAVWFLAGRPGMIELRTDRIIWNSDREPPARPFTPADLATGSDAMRLMLAEAGVPPQFDGRDLPGGEGMYHAGFLRTERQGPTLRLDDGGAVLFYESKPYRAGTVMVARVGVDGAVQWTLDSGIGELREILPDPALPALIGDRPRVPDKVPEPILVVVDLAAGTLTTRSLWMR